MNAIRQTQQLNKRELDNATPPSASWHADYRDTAWLYVGGLPLDLSEGDIVTIFSQFGNPTHLNLIRDRETGKSKGFAFLKYEDQRSCDLAVDNLTGADVLGRLLRVDHTRYKKKDDEDEDTYKINIREAEAQAEQNGKRASDTEDSEGERRQRKRRPMLKEGKELEEVLAIKESGEEEDPMKDYLVREKRDEVEKARKRKDDRERRHRHHHRQHKGDEGDHGSHRRRRRDVGDEDDNHSRSRHHHRDVRDGEDRAERYQARERRRGEASDEESRDRERNGKDHRDVAADASEAGAPPRRSRSRSRELKFSRRRYNPEDGHDRRDSGRDRRRRHEDD